MVLMTTPTVPKCRFCAIEMKPATYHDKRGKTTPYYKCPQCGWMEEDK